MDVNIFVKLLLVLALVMQLILLIQLFITNIIRFKEDKKFWKRMAMEQEVAIESFKAIAESQKGEIANGEDDRSGDNGQAE